MSDLLTVKDLRASLDNGDSRVVIIRDLSTDVQIGKVTALVGQSGSGKTTAALATLGLLDFHIPGVSVRGEVLFKGSDMLRMSPSERKNILGTSIAFIPQSAYAGLNPFISVRRQALEVAARTSMSKKEAIDRFSMLLEFLGLASPGAIIESYPHPGAIIESYPHQLSGGMRQRALIAMALLNEPEMLIADEPTTAVDRTSQAMVLDLIRSICDEGGLGALVVTHDMAVAARMADTVCVLLSGLVMEAGEVNTVLKRPSHPYTKSLLTSLYHVEEQAPQTGVDSIKNHPGCPFAGRCDSAVDRCWKELPEPVKTADNIVVRCHLAGRIPATGLPSPTRSVFIPLEGNKPIIKIRDLSVSYKSGLSFAHLFTRSPRNLAAQHVSFDVFPGQCLGIVGESGAGKTTAMKAATRLIPMENGKVMFSGTDITGMRYGALRQYRALMQVVFQNPDASLNPKMRVESIVLEPAKLHRTYPTIEQAKKAAYELFSLLDLEAEFLSRYPTELSHGQKQRVAIARALILKPKLLFADEPVSALDPYTRSRILGLFRHRQKEQMALVLISHDLEIVRLMSSVTLVMYKGTVVEFGPSEEVYASPIHPYTSDLMSAVLTTDPEIERSRRAKPSPARATGQTSLACPFYPRCPTRKDPCRTAHAELKEIKPGHWAACLEK